MKHLRWVGFLIGLGLFFFILRQSDLSAVWQQVFSLQWRFGLVFLFYLVIFGCDTLGWRFTLDRGAHIRVDRLFRTRLAGEAVNYVTPTAWIGGEPVKAYLLSKRYGIPLREGMASVVVAKTTFTLSMLLFILAGLVVTLATQSVDAILLKWVWMTLSILSFFLALFVLVQFLQPFQRGGWLIERIMPARFLQLGKLHEWDRAITAFYRQSPRALLGSLGFHFLGWVAGVIEVYLIFRFLKIPIDLSTAWSIEALWVLLKSGAFLIPASLGASEGFLLLICVSLGINAVSGLALALIRRARELVWMGLGLMEFSRG